MSEKEFFGANEEEAVDQAASELGIAKENIRYQLVEKKKKGLFSKGGVRIAVLVDEEEAVGSAPESARALAAPIIQFITTLIRRMGLTGEVRITSSLGEKVLLSIESDDSSLLIGKMGKTLDAIQLLANIVAQKQASHPCRVILDCENYRERRQQKLIDFAEEVADHVRRTGSSRLLEPMNPFERRLVHTALTHYSDIETESEGEGLYKQIRVRFRGQRRH